MRQSFRAKLLGILGVLTLGFAVLIGVSSLVEQQVEQNLTLIQERFIPLIALGPKLDHQFERVRRGLQDAVAAQDVDALIATERDKASMLSTLAAARAVMRPELSAALHAELESYYANAQSVSRRLLSGEHGDDLQAAMTAMQTKQSQLLVHLRKATALDHHAIERAFAEASAAQRTATRVRLVVSVASVFVVIVLSFLISRGFLRSLAQLGAGFRRFGKGDFLNLIHEQGDEELVLLAKQANHMAQSLDQVSKERDRSEEELRAANEALAQKARELASVSSYKTQFLANMSHELRTPLNSMLVLSGLLAANESENLSNKQVEFCKTIHGAGLDLLALINQVLDLAKIEAGKQDIKLAQLHLSDLADYARRIFEPLARDKGLAFQLELDEDLPSHIVSDRQRIEQILNNLLGNAIKFTERGAVTLRLAVPHAAALRGRLDLPPSATLALEVMDTGAGIPEEHRRRIFAPFEQLEGSTDRRHNGTGLGLSIARELATLLGGEIQLESQVGRGSKFTCYLPFHTRGRSESAAPQADLDAPAVAGVPREESVILRKNPISSAPTFQAEAASAPFEGLRLLVADDDMRTLYALSALLHAQGAEVLTADTGCEALKVLERHPHLHAVLMDIMMPEMDGHEAMRLIRKQLRFAALPIIALTAKATEADRDECLEAGASAHLAKPIDAERLVELLGRLLNAANSTQSSPSSATETAPPP